MAELASCRRVAAQLARVAGSSLPGPVARHVDRCLACQAELIRYRRLLRMLGALKDEFVELDPTVIAELLAVLDADRPGRARRFGLRRPASLVGALVLVGTTGLAWALRARQLRPAAISLLGPPTS